MAINAGAVEVEGRPQTITCALCGRERRVGARGAIPTVCARGKCADPSRVEALRTYERERARREAPQRRPYMREWHQAHRDQQNAKRMDLYEADKAGHLERVRVRRLKRVYGLTPEAFDDLLASQVGRCAICGSVPGARRFSVDHDHETGRVRGLLCHRCNSGIGLLRDDPALVRAALSYLEAER